MALRWKGVVLSEVRPARDPKLLGEAPMAATLNWNERAEEKALNFFLFIILQCMYSSRLF